MKIKRPRRPWTLRSRLLAALLVLAAAGLAVFGVVSVLLLERSLGDRIDIQLKDIAGKVSAPNRPPPKQQISNDTRLPTDFRIFFYSPDGALETTAGQTNQEIAMPKLPPMNITAVRAEGQQPFTVDDVTGNGRWRVIVVVQEPNGPQPYGGTAAVAASLSSMDTTVHQLETIEVIGGSILLVLLGITATVVVRIGLRPLTRIEHTAQAIAEGELDRRVPDSDPRTETGRLGAALNVMLGRLSSALRDSELSQYRLRRFVADASHELRTPLTSIRGFAELYRRGGATEKADVTRLMQRIESESIRMSQLVEDLLLLARLDQERSLDFTEVDLTAVATDTVHDALAREPERNITLDLPNGPVRVIADEHRIRQVAVNLVGNAVTHTQQHTPIKVSVYQENVRARSKTPTAASGSIPQSAQVVVLEVRDEGTGIPKEQAQFIFDRFYRTDQARSRARGGAGLGLAITAAIMEAHGGRIELISEPNQGTTFRVLLMPA